MVHLAAMCGWYVLSSCEWESKRRSQAVRREIRHESYLHAGDVSQRRRGRHAWPVSLSSCLYWLVNCVVCRWRFAVRQLWYVTDSVMFSMCRYSLLGVQIMTATNYDTNLVRFIQRCQISLTVHLALVFHVFIAVAVIVMVCGRRDSYLGAIVL